MSAAISVPVFQDEQIRFTPNEGEVNRTLTRYIFFPGDLITTKRKHDFKGHDRDAGGEELTSACLWRTRRFLRRGRITPIETGTAWHTKDELDASSRENAIREGTVQRASDPHTLLPTGPILFYGVPVYPGDEILQILATDETNGGFSRGGVEITGLLGREWQHDSEQYGDTAMYRLQQLFFPTYPTLPVTLSGLQGLIARVGNRVADNDLTDSERGLIDTLGLDLEVTANEKIDACDNFRLWGTNFVEMENQRIQAKVSAAGFVHTYTDMAKSVMAQLEIEPLTIAQHKEKASQASAADIGAAVAAAMKQPQENVSTLDALRAAIAQDPESFKALFAELAPKNKGGRPTNAEVERRKAEEESAAD